MKRIRLLQVIQLILLVIAAVGLIAFLGYASRQSISNRSDGLRFNFNFDWRLPEAMNLQILQEEEIASKEIRVIEIHAGSSEVYLTVSEEENVIRMVERGRVGSTNTLLSLSQQDGILSIRKDKSIISYENTFFLFGFNKSHKIEIFIPKDYLGDLNINTASGDTYFLSDFNLKHITINQSSGNVKSNHTIKTQNFEVYLSSGDVRLENLDSENYVLKTSSGDMRINHIVGAKGSIRSSSGDIIIQKFSGGVYNIEASSGSIKLQEAEGAGSIRTSSGDIYAAYNRINDYANLNANSGEIDIKLLESISFEMEANCTSGDITGNFDMNYRNKKGNQASAVVGTAPYSKLKIQTTSGDIKVTRY